MIACDDMEMLAREFQTALGRGAWAEALALCDRLLVGLPGNASLHYNRGLILKMLGRQAESLRSFQAALDVDDGHANARFELAAGLLDQGEPMKAADHFRTYLEAVPDDADARLNLGNALVRLGRPEEALPHLRAAYDTSPSVLATESLAIAERDCGDLARCRALLDTLPADDVQAAAARIKIGTQGAAGSLTLDVKAFLRRPHASS